jgi:inner membrane transporter RhtA
LGSRPAQIPEPGQVDTDGHVLGRRVIRGLGRAPAFSLVVAGLCCLQSGAALTTVLYPVVGPGGVVTLRLCIAAVLLCGFWRPRLRWDAGTFGTIVAAGTLLAAHHLMYYNAVLRLPLGAATTVEFLGPFVLAVAGSRRARNALWAVLALTGVALLGLGGIALNPVGLGFAAVAGACWACYILASSRLARKVSDGSGLALAVLWGALLSLPFGLVSGGTALFSPHVLALGAAVAVLSSVLPYSLQFEAIRRLPAHVFGVFTSLEPAVGALIGLIFLNQHLAVTQWLGIIAVAFASAGAARSAKPPSATQTTPTAE